MSRISTPASSLRHARSAVGTASPSSRAGARQARSGRDKPYGRVRPRSLAAISA